ncbi:MAG TPA: response regulator transcription factor, partial [Puia sp.]|nr:response regulator transcription factor [Puia sp.]
MPVKVVIYEDNNFLRESLCNVIDVSEALVLKGGFPNCDQVIAQMEALQPDVVLMDIEMDGIGGLQGVRLIKQAFPHIEVMMLTVFDDNDKIFQAICNGASGYLLKKVPPEKIVEAVIDLHAGGAPMGSGIARKILQCFSRLPAPSGDTDRLTGREAEVLDLLSKGNSYKMIGDQCGITIGTVR